jgi:excinuclease ABC subunit A
MLEKDSSVEPLIIEITLPESTTMEDLNSLYEQLVKAVESAFEVGKGILSISINGEELRLTSENICPKCNLSLPRLEPKLLNHNTIFGMCLECNGQGIKYQVDPALVITRPERSILDDASEFHLISNLRRSSSDYWRNYIKGIADYYGADLEQPWKDLPEGFQRTLIYGTEGKKIHIEFGAESETGSFNVSRTRDIQGAIHHINRLYRQTKSEASRQYYRQFMREQPCPSCNGEKINKAARFVSLAGKRFPEITDRSIGDLLEWIRSLRNRLDPRQQLIAEELILEIESRLTFICDVGLHYLTLNRKGPTLSGGEAQRIRLASQIGTELKGILYVLDEPTIGLHAHDHSALLQLLIHLRDAGNTVLVVEHDAETMYKADWILDIGPGAGLNGGQLVAEGTPGDIMANPASLTGRYLAGQLQVISTNWKEKRTPAAWLQLNGASLHNLKNLDVKFPLGMMVCITGVSGSGKSSLISHTLSPALAHSLHKTKDVPGPFEILEGIEQLERVIHITQSPIGRNPRSNPGTYVGILTEVRKIFASTGLAKERGYPEGYFSFNSKGGRCETCEGYGAIKVQMYFMADLWIPCQECEGKRFMSNILEIRYQGVNIADVLEMDVEEALTFFHDHPKIKRMLKTLLDVGLGYIKLGQSATTLSGGEAQRVKLAKEVCRTNRLHTLSILDEPTVGLHFSDIQKLLDILNRLVDNGNTVMVIEHNLDVINSADWIIDLGPEGGEDGGYLVAEGTPEQVARIEQSYTGQYLKKYI